MSSLMYRIQRFLSSPQGRRLVEQGRRELASPATRRRLRRFVARLRGRH
ncbi:hypothetical protein [Micromonospora sp. HM5-17]|jgi:hypothetical protein|nr:hypothetical protein [Micromonospora sp. HM5-17]